MNPRSLLRAHAAHTVIILIQSPNRSLSSSFPFALLSICLAACSTLAAFFLRSRGASASILTVSSLSPLRSSGRRRRPFFQWLPGRPVAPLAVSLAAAAAPAGFHAFALSSARPGGGGSASSPNSYSVQIHPQLHIAAADDDDVGAPTWLSMYVRR